MFLYLQLTNKFLFYYEEQLQLFLFSKSYAVDTICQPGGLSVYISRFLTQFYILPFAGAFITSLLLTLICILVQWIFGRLASARSYYLLSVLPSFALLCMHLDFDYRLQGTVAYLLMLCSLYLYIHLSDAVKRLVAGCVLVLFLFLAAGSIALLFAGIVMLWDVLTKPRKCYPAFFVGLEAVLIAVIAVRFAYVGAYRMILLPDAYYDPLVRVSKIYMSWYVFPLCILAVRLLRNRMEAGNALYVCRLLLVLCLLYATRLFGPDPVMKNNMEQDYYVRTMQWDRIISTFPAKDHNLQTYNVLNMALSRKNLLGENLFLYDQRNSAYLVAEWDFTVQNAMALSDVYYWIGDIASSQKLAFEGYVASVNGGNVRLLQRLVETNLIAGAYPVAEKYIHLLKQTLFYRNRAEEQSRFLYDCAALEQDFELGNKRKGLCKDGRYAVSIKTEKTLEQLAVNNPASRAAIEYLISRYLLDKDLDNYRRILEKYYATEVWPGLSIYMQEAVVALEEDDPGYWLRHGVSMKVEQEFRRFFYDIHYEQQRIDFQEWVASAYGHTYWYYFMFKK
jgi:hypothetical protein